MQRLNCLQVKVSPVIAHCKVKHACYSILFTRIIGVMFGVEKNIRLKVWAWELVETSKRYCWYRSAFVRVGWRCEESNQRRRLAGSGIWSRKTWMRRQILARNKCKLLEQILDSPSLSRTSKLSFTLFPSSEFSPLTLNNTMARLKSKGNAYWVGTGKGPWNSFSC